MSNPFQQVIADLNLTPESQGTNYEYGWLFLLLSVMADAQDANPTESTYQDAYRETLHRLRNYDGFGAIRCAEILSPKVGR